MWTVILLLDFSSSLDLTMKSDIPAETVLQRIRDGKDVSSFAVLHRCKKCLPQK